MDGHLLSRPYRLSGYRAYPLP